MRGASFLAFAACAATTCARAQVELRSHQELEAPVIETSLAGVRIGPESTGGDQRLVGWDRVRRVEGTMSDKAQPFLGMADKLWRARTRVERGDMGGAEPLLDDLAQVYGGEQGPSASVVAECLIRCRLSRGAQGSATSAWLWWTSLQERHAASKAPEKAAWVGGATDLPAIIDPGTGLSPSLPPVWTPGGATNAAASSPDWVKLRAQPGASGELAEIYEKAARFEAGLDTEVMIEEPKIPSPGVNLAREMVLARAGNNDDRERARQALRRRLEIIAAKPDPSKARMPVTPRWVEAWCRLAIGRSLIRETDNSMRMRGVIELLHLPARFSADQPFLAGIALAEAAVTMSEVGDDAAAGVLKGELESRFPMHPVVRWERLGKIKETQPASRVAPDA